MLQPCVSQLEPCIACCRGGLGPGKCVCRADPGKRELLAVKRQPEGTAVRIWRIRNVCGRSPGHLRSKMSLLSGTVRQDDPPFIYPAHHDCSCIHVRPPTKGNAWCVPKVYPPWHIARKTTMRWHLALQWGRGRHTSLTVSIPYFPTKRAPHGTYHHGQGPRKLAGKRKQLHCSTLEGHILRIM